MENNKYDNRYRNNYGYEGNLATQMQPQVQPERDRQVVRRKVVRKKNIELLKARVKLVSFISYLFVLGILYTVSNSIVTSKQSDMKTLRSEYNNLVKENSLLEEQIEEITDLNRIYEIASKELNMQKPKTGQVLYVSLAQQSFTQHVGKDVQTDSPRFRMGFK